MSINNVPCFRCVCIAICRYKKFHRLCIDCILVHRFLGDVTINDNTALSNYYWLQNVLDPTTWKVESPISTVITVIH